MKIMESIKKLIKLIPLPMAGLMLGLAAAGNLLSSYGNIFKIIFGCLSFIILLLLVLKIICDTASVIDDLKNPAIAGIAGTFSMGIMLLAAYIHSFLPLTAYMIWIIGILTHCVLIVYFTKNFFNLDIKKVLPSYFVVYVGIAIAGIGAPIFNGLGFGKLSFLFGLISYLILLPVIAYRVAVVKNIPEPLLPTIAIFAAPASLLLVGYLNLFQDKNMTIILLLVCLSVIMLFAVLLYLPKILKLKFYPSYSALTFPFVISAMAIKNAAGVLMKMHIEVPVLKYLVYFEELLAVLLVLYVLARYIGFIYSQYVKVEQQEVRDVV